MSIIEFELFENYIENGKIDDYRECDPVPIARLTYKHYQLNCIPDVYWNYAIVYEIMDLNLGVAVGCKVNHPSTLPPNQLIVSMLRILIQSCEEELTLGFYSHTKTIETEDSLFKKAPKAYVQSVERTTELYVINEIADAFPVEVKCTLLREIPGEKRQYHSLFLWEEKLDHHVKIRNLCRESLPNGSE